MFGLLTAHTPLFLRTDAMDQLEQRVNEFFTNAKKNKPEWREEQMEVIKKVTNRWLHSHCRRPLLVHTNVICAGDNANKDCRCIDTMTFLVFGLICYCVCRMYKCKQCQYLWVTDNVFFLYQDYYKALEDADEKVQLANQIYDLVSNKHVLLTRILVSVHDVVQ